jgi:hypothetical protein
MSEDYYAFYNDYYDGNDRAVDYDFPRALSYGYPLLYDEYGYPLMLDEYGYPRMIDYNEFTNFPEINYQENEIKNAIRYNKPLEPKLHVIICISNPMQYKRRIALAREFMKRFEKEETDVLLYVIELVYNIPGEPFRNFAVTHPDHPRHLQIRTANAPLWAKENLWNIAVEKLLPKNWKCVAFCDADIEFDNPSWAMFALKILNGTKDIIQLHSHCVDLDHKEDAMNIFSGFCYQFVNKRKYMKGGVRFWHPGFNAAMTRETYEKMGGIYDYGILGSGDTHLFLSIIGQGTTSIHPDISAGYRRTLEDLTGKCRDLRMGYVPGVIKHYFHGTKRNRKYTERWKLLVKYAFDPLTHLAKDKQGLYIPTDKMPKELMNAVYNYFAERNEDEYFYAE